MIRKIIRSCILTASVSGLMISCSDDFDKHFHGGTENSEIIRSDLNCFELMKEDADLSEFVNLLTRTQYDSVLCASQTFTVWAPTNEAIQNSGIDLNDSVYVTKFVENHIARFLHSTSNLQRKSVLMKNLKKLIFAYDGSSYSINGNKLVNTGVAVKNGVVYKVEDVNPYLYNIYEYMEYTPGFDSINTFFKYYESKELDVENSTVIGVNGENQNVYDTVWKYSNTLLSAIGRLDLEDSIYTAILPNNDAWNSAFENRLSYHKIFVDRNTVDPAADSARMMLRSKLAIVQDLVYRGQLVNPEALNNSTDSLVSTNYNVFYSPGYLFQGLTPETLSNGVVYTTDALRYKNHESWQYPIRVEAEWDTYGRTENLCQLTTTTMASTPDVPISNNRYIYCEATSTGSLAKIFVTFPIPNVLSAKYNVYVYMLPSKISKPAEHATPLEGKVRCYMYYTGADGLEKTVSTSIVPVSADTVTKILVAENFEFPYWNPLLASTSGTIDTKSITTKVRVENSVSNNEHKQGKFDRIMRIDCIRFEPVEE